MNIITASNYNTLSQIAAQKAADYIRGNPNSLVCFAAGDTPLGMFKELIAMQNRGEIDLSSIWYVGLDEWVGLGSNDVGSCVKVMTDNFYEPAGISKERIRLFDGLALDINRECREMENWIVFHGGIGLTLLGVGMNGHIGFNEPGTPEQEGCFTVELDNTTKIVSAKYFGKELPVSMGVTIGWKTLMKADRVVIMACGEKKASIMEAVIEGEVSLEIPGSLFRQHPNVVFLLDDGAATGLSIEL